MFLVIFWFSSMEHWRFPFLFIKNIIIYILPQTSSIIIITISSNSIQNHSDTSVASISFLSSCIALHPWRHARWGAEWTRWKTVQIKDRRNKMEIKLSPKENIDCKGLSQFSSKGKEQTQDSEKHATKPEGDSRYYQKSRETDSSLWGKNGLVVHAL